MFWQEEKDKPQEYVVPDDVQDLLFSIECKTLPLDHAAALSRELMARLPWLAEESTAGIHLIHVAESGNGWYRPQDPENEVLHVSRRTKMTLRLPKHRLGDAEALSNETLNIDGYTLTVKKSAGTRKLSPITTVFARYVMGDGDMTEDAFMQYQYDKLTREFGIKVTKMMCGKQTRITGPEGTVYTRSLMLADLEVDDSVKLQQHGLGEGRKFGCGLFMPHKSVKAVHEPKGSASS